MAFPMTYERKNKTIDAIKIKKKDFLLEISIRLFYFISSFLPNVSFENLSLSKIYTTIKLYKLSVSLNTPRS